MAVNGVSPNHTPRIPGGSGGDAATGKPSDQIHFNHYYEQTFPAKIPEWKDHYDKWIERNRNLIEVVGTFESDPRFTGQAGVELNYLVNRIAIKRMLIVDQLKQYKELWERNPGSENPDPNIDSPPTEKTRDYVLKLAEILRYNDFLKVAKEPVPPATVESPAPKADPQPVEEISLIIAPIESPPPAPPVADTFPPDPQQYHSKYLSLGVGAGRSLGKYGSFSPPTVGPRREEWVTSYDAAASFASPTIPQKSDLSMPTLQLQAILHPLALFDATASTVGSSLSLLGNFQAIKEKFDTNKAHFQMLQIGVGLDLEPLFQKHWPLDISIHGYFLEWGGEALKKTEFQKYTRGGAPFVQAGICGGWNIDDNFTLQGCGDWREKGFSTEFRNMWGKSGDSVNFHIVSANLLYHFRK